MPEYLWTNESAWCLCGHHITDHQTFPVLLDPVFVCNGEDLSGMRRCECKEFKPYKNLAEEEDN